MEGKSGSSEDTWWKHFLAGGLAGAVSRTCTAPLDRLKVMAQVSGKPLSPILGIKEMIREGGVKSMWRGNGINVLKIAPENAVKFLSYDEIKRWMIEKGDRNRTLYTYDRILAAGIAGTIAHTVIYPLEVVKTRMVLHHTGETNGIIKTFIKGYKMNGHQIFFKGYVTSIFGIFTFCAVDLSTYEAMKNTYKETISADKDITIIVILACGLLSSFLGNMVAYPLGMIGTYIQFADVPHMSGLELARKIAIDRWKNYGIRGLYKGMYIASIKIVPSVAITYMVYEFFLHLLGTEMTK